MENGLELFKSPEERKREADKKAKIDLRFFLTFIGAVAYLQDTLWDEFVKMDHISIVEPGVHTTNCKRSWAVGGLPVEDEVTFRMDNRVYISGVVGHPQDFSTLIVWGVYEDENPDLGNPVVGAFWQSPMAVWFVPKDYHLENSRPLI